MSHLPRRSGEAAPIEKGEIARLRRTVRDLVGLLAVPAAWNVEDPTELLVLLLDALIATLELDFCCVRLTLRLEGWPVLVARSPGVPAGNALSTDAWWRALEPWLDMDPSAPVEVPNPSGRGTVSVLTMHLGLHDDLGILLVAARRPGFPIDMDRLLLRVATNQVAIGLQEAWRWGERIQLEEQLERRVEERTAQLAEAMQALGMARERALAARYEAVLQERTRLARELHDTLLQGFTGVALKLVAVARRVGGSSETRVALSEVIDLAQRTLADARRAVWGLRTPTMAGEDLPSALRAMVREATRGGSVEYELKVEGSTREMSIEGETIVRRIAQEAISNVVRHAAARRVDVVLAFEGDSVRLRVTDDGHGFVVDPEFRTYGGHWGLVGMRERAAAAGGSLRVSSHPGSGTTVELVLPLATGGAGLAQTIEFELPSSLSDDPAR